MHLLYAITVTLDRSTKCVFDASSILVKRKCHKFEEIVPNVDKD